MESEKKNPPYKRKRKQLIPVRRREIQKTVRKLVVPPFTLCIPPNIVFLRLAQTASPEKENNQYDPVGVSKSDTDPWVKKIVAMESLGNPRFGKNPKKKKNSNSMASGS